MNASELTLGKKNIAHRNEIATDGIEKKRNPNSTAHAIVTTLLRIQ